MRLIEHQLNLQIAITHIDRGTVEIKFLDNFRLSLFSSLYTPTSFIHFLNFLLELLAVSVFTFIVIATHCHSLNSNLNFTCTLICAYAERAYVYSLDGGCPVLPSLARGFSSANASSTHTSHKLDDECSQKGG